MSRKELAFFKLVNAAGDRGGLVRGAISENRQPVRGGRLLFLAELIQPLLHLVELTFEIVHFAARA
ncbi:MAG: hypothetical protein WCD59_15180, partial [Pseudolabrys sp.]